MKKLISIVLAICLMCSGLICFAQDEVEIEPRNSAYFVSYGTTLSRYGDGKIKIVFSTQSTGIATTLGVATYQVERLDDNGNWEDCSGTRNGKTASNVSSYTFGKYFYGIAGETYRVKATFLCVMNGGAETKAYTSARITAN